MVKHLLHFLHTKPTLAVGLLFLLILILPLTVVVLQQQMRIDSKAAGVPISEAEQGQLSGPVAVENDSLASGGKYIKFLGHSTVPGVSGQPAPGGSAKNFIIYGSSRFADPGETIPAKHQRYAAMLDNPPAYRKFNTGTAKTWSADADLAHIMANEPTLKVVVFSAVGTQPVTVDGKTFFTLTQAEIEAHVKSVPADRQEVFVWHHEPDDEWLTTAQTERFRQEYVTFASRVHAVGRSNVKVGMILMGSQIAKWKSYYPGNGVLDVMGWDRYNGISSGVYKSPAELYDPVWDAYKQTDAPEFLLGETGSDINAGAGGAAARGIWAKSVVDYWNAKATQGARYILWWDSVGDGTAVSDIRLKLDPPGTGAREVWRAACVASKAALGL